jgi:hypothetical protein
MAHVVHVVLGLIIVALAVGALGAALRMRHLFDRGTAARPLKMFAASPALMAAAESFHILFHTGAGELFDLLAMTFETGFFVLLTVAAILFVRSWMLPDETPSFARPSSSDESTVLAGIVNESARELAKVIGPSFTYGLIRRVAQPMLDELDEAAREAAVSRLDRAVTAPPARPPGWSGIGEAD